MTRWYKRRKLFSGLAAAAVAVPLAACSAGGGTAAGTGHDTITIGIGSAPVSLDPARAANSSDGQAYTDLAYEPLIRLNSDGSLAPALATSWRYTDAKLTTFEVTLRHGVRFSDGSPLTATDVVHYLSRAKTTNGVVTPYAAAITRAQAVGTDRVVLHLAAPNPTIAQVLTQRYYVGSIVGPIGESDPNSLGTSTDGAGPYLLDKAGTVANDHYTYVPNPYYYDKSAVHFTKFTIRVIGNPQTALSTLKSGQVAYVGGDFSTVDEAKSSGYSVYSAVSDWYGVFLIDRSGTLVPALAKQGVRQALNYALDRRGIAKALFGSYGVPTSEISDIAYANDGYDPDYVNYYGYDPAKAKQLLEQNGYADGFGLTIAATTTYGDGVEVAQAIAGDWAKLGVRVTIKTYPSVAAMGTDVGSKKYPAFAGNLDVQPMFLESTQILDKDAGFFNPFRYDDPTLSALLATARAATSSSAVAAGWAAVERRVVELGWFAPVASGPTLYYGVKGLTGIALSAANFVPDPTQFHY